MDYKSMESLTLNGCFLSDIGKSFNIETSSSEQSDYLLNDNLGTASSSDEYNILNLDGFIQDISNIDSIIAENVAISEAVTRPKVYLLDENVKKFEDLLENDIVDKIAGNLITVNHRENAIETLTSTTLKFECENCEQIFGHKSHLTHICAYNSDKQLIFDDNIKRELLEKDVVMGILRQNNIRLNIIIEDFAAAKLNSSGDDPSKKAFTCKICKRAYVHGTGLARHMKTHGKDHQVPFKGRKIVKVMENVKSICKCLFCGRIFSNIFLAYEHYQRNHKKDVAGEFSTHQIDSTVSLGVGGGSTAIDATRKSLQHHTRGSDPSSKIFKATIIEAKLHCEFCDFDFSDVTSLLTHEYSHNPSKGFECTYCRINVTCLKTISNHWSTECPFEQYETERQINLPTFFVCNVCESKFKSLEDLYDHRYLVFHFFPRLNVMTGKLQISCERCDSHHCNAKSLIDHHEEVHLKLNVKKEVSETYRPYLCDICGKGYTQSSHLYQHLRFHQGIKPFGCPKPGCTRRFTIRPDLNDHIRKCHTGERPYHCTECGKSFLTGSVFYQHRLIHRGERRYECTSCGKRFHRSDALKNHERIHTGDKPFPCTMCSKSFRQKGDRDKHLKSRHKHNEIVAVNREPSISPNFFQHILNVGPVVNNVNGIDVLSMI